MSQGERQRSWADRVFCWRRPVGFIFRILFSRFMCRIIGPNRTGMIVYGDHRRPESNN